MSHSPAQSGNLVEVFSGIQGEGLYVGRRQIFIRLCGCNLACDFCDTEGARRVPSVCRIELTPGDRDFAQFPNPLRIEKVIECVTALNQPLGLHHAAVLTGGEPLDDIEWATAVARGLKESGIRVMLETNGTLAESLVAILPFVDLISMDIKLPSASGQDSFAAHEGFMAIAADRNLYVKMVVCMTTTNEEVSSAARMVESAGRSIPLVLQPVTIMGGVRPPSAEQMLEWQSLCARHLDDVRVIPQCHRILGQL